LVLPVCYSDLLIQPSVLTFIKINPLALKTNKLFFTLRTAAPTGDLKFTRPFFEHFSFSCSYFFYQKDKRAKPENLLKGDTISHLHLQINNLSRLPQCSHLSACVYISSFSSFSRVRVLCSYFRGRKHDHCKRPYLSSRALDLPTCTQTSVEYRLRRTDVVFRSSSRWHTRQSLGSNI